MKRSYSSLTLKKTRLFQTIESKEKKTTRKKIEYQKSVAWIVDKALALELPRGCGADVRAWQMHDFEGNPHEWRKELNMPQ